MSANLLIPSVDRRIAAFEEHNRKQRIKTSVMGQKDSSPSTVTLSREFGCEAYPVAEILSGILAKKTGVEWMVMDKALLEEVSRREHVSEEIIRSLGEKNRFLDEVLATFSPRWKTDRDRFRSLASLILSLASDGNVIIVGRGAAIITAHLSNCRHYRLYASDKFKNASIVRRMNISEDEAADMIKKRQKERDHFTMSFLGRDAHDSNYYDLCFNNDRNSAGKIAWTIARHLMFGVDDESNKK